jgi:outer membrane lipoprotein
VKDREESENAGGVIEFHERVIIFGLKEGDGNTMRARIFVLLPIFLFACAPVISKETREGVDNSLTFKVVAQSPDTYKGKIVLWGGEIIQTLPQGDGTTFIEVLEWPLGWAERPRRVVSFQGKFLVLLKEPLDSSLCRSGARVTVAGEIQGSMEGEKIESVSDSTYRYPLLLSNEIHVWKRRSYPYSSVPDYRDTWEYRRNEGILRY